jgi:hypothetical protein
MARHKRDYCGEHFTEFVGFKCTPSQRGELVAVTRRQLVTVSDFTREIVFAHLGNAPVAVVRRPDPVTLEKLRAMERATHAVNGLRSLMNQIAKHGNITQEVGPYAADLREGIRRCEHLADTLFAATQSLVAA